jgi:uncharacterized delta-60 repeat protein
MKKIIKSWRVLSLILVVFVLMGMSGKAQAFFTSGDGGSNFFASGFSGANGQVAAIAIQQDGKTIIGGSFTSYNGIERISVARLNVDGTLDESFTPVTGAGSFIRTIAIQPDGKILIGGIIHNSNVSYLSYNRRVIRLNTDGTLDTSFTDPTATWSQDVRDIEIQSDGKIIIGGYFSRWQSSNGSTVRHLARLNSDGTLDTHFCNAVISSNLSNVVNTVAIQSDGKILAGGSFQIYNGSLRNYLVRFNSDGTLDTTFNTKLTFNAGIYEISDIAIQSDGKIIAGGRYQIDDGSMRNYIARFNSDGSLDESFNAEIESRDWIYWISSMAIQSDGKIIIGGNFQIYKNDNSNYRVNVARLNVDGTVDYGFGSENGPNNDVRSVTIQPDGKILIGGNFTAYGGNEANYLAHLNNDGALDMSFNLEVLSDWDKYTPQPLDCLPIFDVQRDDSKENLVIITHGWDGGSSDNWIMNMRDNIKSQTEPTKTSVGRFDWGEKAKGLPWDVYVNAFDQGRCLAKQIIIHDPVNIHLIAHSAGSNVIQTAVDELAKYYYGKNVAPENAPRVHLSFLDAYAPTGGFERYGDLSAGMSEYSLLGYAEQYVDTRHFSIFEDHTDIRLQNAVNFNVTPLDYSTAPKVHEWPYIFYNYTVVDPQYNWKEIKLGYHFSTESKTNIKIPRLSGGTCFTVSDVSRPYADMSCWEKIFEKETTYENYINESNPFVVSASGTVAVVEKITVDAANGFRDLVTNLFGLFSGSPSWIKFDVVAENPVNVIEFDYLFPSKATASAGQFTVFIDDKLVFSRNVLEEDGGQVFHGRVGLPETLAEGSHAITFRIDPLSEEQSIVYLADIRLGLQIDTDIEVHVDVDVPEIKINSPVDGEKYVLNSAINADWSATDEGSGIDAATGTVASGNQIDTSSIGSKSFSVTATDLAGNSVTETVSYDVIYDFGGFQNPVAEDGKTFNNKSTIPVTFQLTDANGNYISDAVANLIIGDGIEAVSSGSSNEGNKFRYDHTNNQYVFNLSLKDISLETGTHTLKIVLGDGTIYDQFVVIK